jgi:hypothetical protein
VVDEGDRVELREGLRSRSVGVQARSARGLLDLGRAEVPTLAATLGRKKTSLAVRERIVENLAALKPATRETLPQLDRLAAAAPSGGGVSDSREARLAASARAASERIRARSDR